jgi:hypothetical protein
MRDGEGEGSLEIFTRHPHPVAFQLRSRPTMPSALLTPPRWLCSSWSGGSAIAMMVGKVIARGACRSLSLPPMPCRDEAVLVARFSSVAIAMRRRGRGMVGVLVTQAPMRCFERAGGSDMPRAAARHRELRRHLQRGRIHNCISESRACGAERQFHGGRVPCPRVVAALDARPMYASDAPANQTLDYSLQQ